ncbi:hypothetical protein [Burkholderia stagnalis]|uniref:hypothetical protein n=1 Tax=Burkholderia stagnalis TaxID=1503054 RepID=UPI000B2DB360
MAQIVQQRAPHRHALAIVFDRPQPPVAVGLPADVLGQRPDRHAAEFRLLEALANIDVPRTSVDPSFRLIADIGTSSPGFELGFSNPGLLIVSNLSNPAKPPESAEPTNPRQWSVIDGISGRSLDSTTRRRNMQSG